MSIVCILCIHAIWHVDLLLQMLASIYRALTLSTLGQYPSPIYKGETSVKKGVNAEFHDAARPKMLLKAKTGCL